MPKEDPFVNRAQLLKAIKKYPEIWDSNNKLHMCRSVTAPMWNEIAEQFGGHVPTVKLQSIWSQMKYHYHNLVHRQILHKERFTTKWEHFEPMSFMYNITVAKIVGASTIPVNSSQPSDNASNISNALPMPNLREEQQQQQQQQQQQPQSQMNLRLQPNNGGGVDGSDDGVWLNNNMTVPPSINEVNIETTPYTVFTGLITPPAAIPLNANTNASATVTASVISTRRLGRPNAMNNGMRARIIDCIRSHPTLWAGRPSAPLQRSSVERHSQNRTSAVWKEVAVELGLTPSLVQTRWSIIKQRYVDELQKERHAQYVPQVFHSNWEHFDRMSFMRATLMRKVDEREQTREHIEEIVCEQQQQQRYVRQNAIMKNEEITTDGAIDARKMLPSETAVGNESRQQEQHIMPLSVNDNVVSSAVDSVLPSANAALLNGGPPVLHGGHTIYHPHALMHPSHVHGHFVPYHQNPSLHSSVTAAATGAFVSNSRLAAGRRVKPANDLEWDPFEMIMHVQGPEIAPN